MFPKNHNKTLLSVWMKWVVCPITKEQKNNTVKTDQRSLLCHLRAVFVCFLACHHAYWSCTHYHAILATSNQKEEKLCWNETIAYFLRNVPETSTNSSALRHNYRWYLLPTYWCTAVFFFTLLFECIKIMNTWRVWIRFPDFPCQRNKKCEDCSRLTKA